MNFNYHSQWQIWSSLDERLALKYPLKKKQVIHTFNICASTIVVICNMYLKKNIYKKLKKKRKIRAKGEGGNTIN